MFSAPSTILSRRVSLLTSIPRVFRFRAQIRDGVETKYARPIQTLANKRVEMESSAIAINDGLFGKL